MKLFPRFVAAALCLMALGTPTGGVNATGDTVPDPSVPETSVPDGQEPIDGPDVTSPLIPVPVGCDSPEQPHVVFLGTVVNQDYRTVRFSIDQIRAGDPAPFVTSGLVDIRFGLDAQYLDLNEQYLVGAVVDPVLGILTSRVTPPIEDFGGDEVIGLSETDIDCPVYEDPKRTLWPDGSAIDGGVLDPLGGSKTALLSAITMPLAVAVGVIFVLALVRNGGVLALRTAIRMSRPKNRLEQP